MATATAPKQRDSVSEFVSEYASNGGAKLPVDRENGIIRGVKILGLESKNGRTYKPHALRVALSLYEGSKVNTDHPDRKDATRDRLVDERIGVIRNVTFTEGQGLYADFHYNPKHRLADQIVWDAEHAPENLGFSPQHGIKGFKSGGKVVVEAITGVRSVDLVADPATTSGFFESIETKDEPMTADQITLDLLESRDDLKAAIIRQYTESESVKQTQTEQATELATLRADVAKYKAAEALESRKQAVDKAITEAKLPEAVVTESFRQLCYGSNDETLPKLIAEWQGIAKGIKSAAGKPVSRSQTDHAFESHKPSDPAVTAAKYRAA